VFHHVAGIDIEAAVAHPVAHAGDHAPRHFTMRGPDLIAYASCASPIVSIQ
jgi:hypothetical protein